MGYLVTFEHENEANELLKNRSMCQLFIDILGEKEVKQPYLLKFEVLDEYCKGKLKDKLFSLHEFHSMDLI